MINWRKILWYTILGLVRATLIAMIFTITYYLGWRASVYLAIGWTLRSVVLYLKRKPIKGCSNGNGSIISMRFADIDKDIQPSLVGVLKENGIHPKDAIISWYQPDEEMDKMENPHGK